MNLICPILFMGPSAITAPAVDIVVRPSSVEGKAFIEAGASGDLAEAARIGTQRTRDNYPQLTFSEETPGGPGLKILTVANGACLDPHIEDGDTTIADVVEPTEGQLVFFHIKGHPAGFNYIKVFYQILYRRNNYIATFGENQPDKIYSIVQTNPLALVLIADHDIDIWRRVPMVIRRNKTVWNVDKFPLSLEHEKAIKAATNAPSI